MKAKVSKDVCIGCGACTVIASQVFELDDDGLAKIVTEEVPNDEQENVIDASESCPTGAITVEEK